MLCTQHLAKADEADAEDALRTLDAAYRGFLPFVRMAFLENNMNTGLSEHIWTVLAGGRDGATLVAGQALWAACTIEFTKIRLSVSLLALGLMNANECLTIGETLNSFVCSLRPARVKSSQHRRHPLPPSRRRPSFSFYHQLTVEFSDADC